jgi:hypothetical protein
VEVNPLMPLYVCDNCGCIDNTALGGYWVQQLHDLPVLCSTCRTGKWHGHFDRKPWDGVTEVINPPAPQPRRRRDTDAP